jgi:protein-arginine kinase activator protein McsA
MSDIPNVIQDPTPTIITCRCCGKTFTKRADEGASQCYECYQTNPNPHDNTKDS